MTRLHRIGIFVAIAIVAVIYITGSDVLSKRYAEQNGLPDMYKPFAPASVVSSQRAYASSTPAMGSVKLYRPSAGYRAAHANMRLSAPTAIAYSPIAMQSTSGMKVYQTSSAQIHSYGSGGSGQGGVKSSVRHSTSAFTGGATVAISMPSMPVRTYASKVSQVGATEAPMLSSTAQVPFASPRRLPGGGVDFGDENGGEGVENTGFEQPLDGGVFVLLFLALCYTAVVFFRRRRAKIQTKKRGSCESLFLVVPTGIENCSWLQ